MTTTLKQMLDELVLSTGIDTAGTRTVLTRGINAGMFLSVLLFSPKDFNITTQHTPVANEDGDFVVNLNNYRMYEVIGVWNYSHGKHVHRMDYEDLRSLRGIISESYIRFYAVRGKDVIFAPEESDIVNISYRWLPLRVSYADDAVVPDDHLEFIQSVAMQFYWASREEGESQQMWQSFSDRLNLPFAQVTQLQKMIRGEAPYGHNVRNIVQQGSA